MGEAKGFADPVAAYPDNYRVLFEEDTERPGTSPLNNEKRDGTDLSEN